MDSPKPSSPPKNHEAGLEKSEGEHDEKSTTDPATVNSNAAESLSVSTLTPVATHIDPERKPTDSHTYSQLPAPNLDGTLNKPSAEDIRDRSPHKDNDQVPPRERSPHRVAPEESEGDIPPLDKTVESKNWSDDIDMDIVRETPARTYEESQKIREKLNIAEPPADIHDWISKMEDKVAARKAMETNENPSFAGFGTSQNFGDLSTKFFCWKSPIFYKRGRHQTSLPTTFKHTR